MYLFMQYGMKNKKMNKYLIIATFLILSASLELNANGDVNFTSPYNLISIVDIEKSLTGKVLNRSSGVLGKSNYMATSKIPINSNFDMSTMLLTSEVILKKLKSELIGSPHHLSITSNAGDEKGISHFDIIVECEEYDLFFSVNLLPDYLLSTIVHIPNL